MADCYTAQEKRFPSNGVVLFVPVACPAATGLPTLVALEGQKDTSLSMTGDTVEVRDKGSGNFKEYLPTSIGGEISVTGGLYKPEHGPAQTIMWEAFFGQTLIGVQFQAGAPVVAGNVGLSYFATAHITSMNISGTLDDGDAGYDMTVQLTGAISQDANNIKVIV